MPTLWNQKNHAVTVRGGAVLRAGESTEVAQGDLQTYARDIELGVLGGSPPRPTEPARTPRVDPVEYVNNLPAEEVQRLLLKAGLALPRTEAARRRLLAGSLKKT